MTRARDPPRSKTFPGGRHLLTGKWKQFVVLAGRRRCVGDGPVDRAVIRENHQRRAGFRARNRTLGAYGLLEVLGEGASRVEHVALDGVRLSVRVCREGTGRGASQECQRQEKVAKPHGIAPFRGLIVVHIVVREGPIQ